MSERKICKCNGCYALNEPGSLYCKNHTYMEQADRERKLQYFKNVQPAEWNHLYESSRWKNMRKEILKKQPLCRCGAKATEVHHVIPHRGDTSIFFDEDNLVALCHHCHGEETKREARERAQKFLESRRKLWY